MPLYLISGPSGSGKSTVGRILQQRGYRVIETDFEDGLSAWFDTITGQKVTDMPVQPYPKEWLSSHRWLWDKTRMRELIAAAEADPVFFCGGAHNESEFYDVFQKRFGLWVNGKTLVKRLQPREPERWVSDSAELARMLEWNEKFRGYCRKKGAIVVDSSVSPDAVVDTIVKQL
jgi:shikimate kinase